MNELFGGQRFLDLNFYYKIEKNKFGQSIPVAIQEDEYNKLKVDEKTKDKAKCLHCKWKMPTWKVANDLLKASTKWNFHVNEDVTSWNEYRSARLKTLLIGWDAKEDDGKDIPCTSENIDNLHQTIAFELLKMYDGATMLDKGDEQKN